MVNHLIEKILLFPIKENKKGQIESVEMSWQTRCGLQVKIRKNCNCVESLNYSFFIILPQVQNNFLPQLKVYA